MGEAEKKTPLFDQHKELGGRIVDYAGFMLPVQYKDLIEEHMAVRQNAGLFDVSHMGEILLDGDDALDNLNYIFTNDFTSMSDGAVRYSPMCNERGGIVDDMLIYRFSQDRYMVVPNAANREKVFGVMKERLKGNVRMEDRSDDFAQIALQGPKSFDILSRLTGRESFPGKYYTFTEKAEVAGASCIVSQTGYTGEPGYELYCSPDDAPGLWQALLEAGKDDGLIPCGLGARDTLRLEASMPLYGHEMNDDISPLETGLAFAVKMSKPDFAGKKAIEERGTPKIARVGLKVTGRGIVREGCPLYIGEDKIGESTSGTYLPYLKGAYAMALVDIAYKDVGTVIEAEVRGKRVEAEIVPLPFYQTAAVL